MIHEDDMLENSGLTEEFRQILDIVEVAVFIDSKDGYALWLNKAAEDLYAIKRGEIIGRHMNELEKEGIFAPSLTSSILEKGRGDSFIHENRMGRKLVTSGRPLKDKNGNIVKVVTYSIDITKVVHLEKKLQKMQMAIEELTCLEGFRFGELIINSHSMREIIRLAKKLSEIDATILISGESGTGKSIIARLIHENGNRKDFPFIKINCGAIPDNLLESELFGYESGAFTGSSKGGKTGLFEAAHKGTVFLDEVSELPLNLQVKLLQVLQEREIQRIGSTGSIPIDVRVISATNKNLSEMVSKGEFREDLFYRLNVIPVNIPPLRERPEDILVMINRFLKNANEKNNENKIFDSNAISLMIKYRWPGNVRELENVIERLVVTTKEETIVSDHLPDYIRETGQISSEIFIPGQMTLKEGMALAEKQMILNARSRCRTTREIAALLDVNQSTVVRKLQKYSRES